MSTYSPYHVFECIRNFSAVHNVYSQFTVYSHFKHVWTYHMGFCQFYYSLDIIRLYMIVFSPGRPQKIELWLQETESSHLYLSITCLLGLCNACLLQTSKGMWENWWHIQIEIPTISDNYMLGCILKVEEIGDDQNILFFIFLSGLKSVCSVLVAYRPMIGWTALQDNLMTVSNIWYRKINT